MTILISVNGNDTGEGFLIYDPIGTRTFPVPVGLRTDDGTTVNATLQALAGGASVEFDQAAVEISPVETTVQIHATSASSARNDTVLQVVVGAAVQASFDLTSISDPEIWYRGRFEARFATDPDKYYHDKGTSASSFKAFALEGEPDFVPAAPNPDGSPHDNSLPDRIDKFVGRVVRFHNSPVSRSHVEDIGVFVNVIKATVGGSVEEFFVGDPILGLPINLGPGSYFAANNDGGISSTPAPEETHGAGFEPISNFEFHIGDIFSGTSLIGPYVPGTVNSNNPRSPDHRPFAAGFVSMTSDEINNQYSIGSHATFSNARRAELLIDYNGLPAAAKPDPSNPTSTGTVEGRNLFKRISNLGGDSANSIPNDAAPDLPWTSKEEYTGDVNDAIVFNPNNSSVMSFLAGFDFFEVFIKFFNFHTDELRGQVDGSFSANTSESVPEFQDGIYNIESLNTAAFNALTPDQMTQAGIDAILGGAGVAEHAVVDITPSFKRLVISKAVVANPADPPASWTLASRSEALVGEYLPQASVFPRDLYYAILPPRHERNVLGACEGAPFAPPPTIGIARVFWDATDSMWKMILHAGQPGANGVTYAGSWAGSPVTVPTGCTPDDVELLTPTIDFGNVEEGMTMYRQIVMLNRSAGAVTVSLPVLALPFGRPSDTNVNIPADGIGTLLVSFTADAPGVTSPILVTLGTNPVVVSELNVNLTGTSVPVATMDVVLVLDRSYSMTEPALTGFRTISKAGLRNQAAQFFVDLLRPGDRIGMVRYNQNAQPHMALEAAGPEGTGAGRMSAAASLADADLNPSGSTSVGDGMTEANTMLAGPTTSVKKSMVVLSDGKENQPVYINDVTLATDVSAYSIGLGLPQNINVQKLDAVTGNTGGYLLVTGELDQENEFRLHKYYAQILSGIANDAIVVDPRAVISRGETQRIPFYLSEADAHFDVILLTHTSRLVFALEAPDGTIVNRDNVAGFNGQFVNGGASRYYRMQMPIFPGNLARGFGKWHVVVTHLGNRRDPGKDMAFVADHAAHGERERNIGLIARTDPSQSYNILIRARSSITMRAVVEQLEFGPGSKMAVVAYMTAFGLPFDQDVHLVAQVTRPDGTNSLFPLVPVSQGRFEAQLNDNQLMGVHNIVVRAAGKTPAGWALQREQTITGTIVRPVVDSGADGTIQEIAEILKQEGMDDLAKVITEYLSKNSFGLLLGKLLPLALIILIVILIVILILMILGLAQ